MPSGVKTPELDVQAYKPMEAPPPVPEMSTNNQLPSGAGFVHKGGAAAFVASNIINGYIKGRQHASEMKQYKAQQQIQGADYTYKTMAENYNTLLRNGKTENDPDVLKAKQAAMDAWSAKLNVMGQYVMPEDEGKKKGAKQKTEGLFKHVFGKEGIQPQVIPAAALGILKQSPPPGLGLTPQDKLTMTEQKREDFALTSEQKAAQRADEQFGWIKDEQKRKQRFVELASMTPDQMSLGQKDELNMMTRLQAIEKDPIRGARDYDLSAKIMGGAKMSQGELRTAMADGLIQGPHIEQHTNAQGTDELVSIDPATGSIIGRSSLGRHYTGDAAAQAMALAKAQQKMQFDELKKAFPDADDSSLYQAMALENSKHPEQLANYIGSNPVQKAKDVQAVNSALKAVWGEYYDPNTTHAKDPKVQREHAIIENLITTPNVNDQTGTFAFKDELVPSSVKSVWHMFKPNEQIPQYSGNATPQELQSAAKALYNRTRQALQAQGKGKYTEADLDRMLPPSRATISGYGGMPNGSLEQPPKAASNRKPTGYNVTTSDGQTHFYDLTQFPETAVDQVQAQHPDVKIEPIYAGLP